MEKLRLSDKSRESTERRRTWHVEEQFSEARDEARGSEDGYIATDHCVAILDGVSTTGDPKSEDGLTPGQFAVQQALEALRTNPELKAEDCARFLTDVIRRSRTADVPGTPSFVFVAFFPKENRVVRVGDCRVMIDGVGYNPDIAPDRAKGVLRKRILEREQAGGKTDDELHADDPSRARLRELRTWQDTYANNADAPDLGYGVVNGDTIPEQFVEYISVPPETRSVILASDGYPPSTLRPTLHETEIALYELEETDPLGIASDAPSTRSNKPRRGQPAADDRTYIRIEPSAS